MEFDIKFVKPGEISLDTLVRIREKSFDDVYLEKCRFGLEAFEGNSYVIALHNDIVIAYYRYSAPNDKAFMKYAKDIKYSLKWRKEALSENPDLTEFFEQCSRSSGLIVNDSNNDMLAFPGEVTFDESKDVYSAEVAVLPEYRKKGVSKRLVQEARRKMKSEDFDNIFFYNRKDSIMYKMNIKRGDCKRLFQFGPVFKDGSSLVLWTKKL